MSAAAYVQRSYGAIYLQSPLHIFHVRKVYIQGVDNAELSALRSAKNPFIICRISV